MRISDWSSDVCSSDLAEKHRGLLADGDHVDLDALVLPLPDLAQQLAEQVVVEAAGEAAVGRHAQVADPLRVLALDHVRMAVIGIGDRKSVVSGKSVSVRVDVGGRRVIKKKKNK